MARLARTVIPDTPHLVTQRGNNRADTFFGDADYELYLEFLAEHAEAAGVAVWAYVLMPNHVHLVLTPQGADGIRRAVAPVHRAYAGHLHARLGRSGHFWQGRFGCVAMDEAHFGAALRYLAYNPVRARLVAKPTDWRWSSVHAQLGRKRGDAITDTAAVRAIFPDVAGLIGQGEDAAGSDALRRAETIGRPLGDAAFIERLERLTGRMLAPARRGRPAKPR